jgi:hypothetical protein
VRPMRIPGGWQVAGTGRERLLLRRMSVTAPDGHVFVWSSWHHRRGLGLLDGSTGRRVQAAPSEALRRSRWIAALFIGGSAGFALGSVSAVAAALPGNAAWVFFVASLFFTSAAYLQFHEAANAGEDLDGQGRTRVVARRRTELIGWWAAAVQLAGTVAFNVSTMAAVFASARRVAVALVWAPDVVGSVAFLVASGLALAEVGTRPWRASVRSPGWWVAGINLAGSVAFGVSAVAARVTPVGDVANLALVNATTFVGAVCFLAGAALLPVAVAGFGERRF